MGVEENIRQRAAAYEMLELIEATAEEFTGSPERFYQVLRDELKLVLKEKPKPDRSKMKDQESKAFGAQLIPFGEFRTRRVDDVPLERLQWYADQTFVDDLRRYLNSDRIKAEMR